MRPAPPLSSSIEAGEECRMDIATRQLAGTPPTKGWFSFQFLQTNEKHVPSKETLSYMVLVCCLEKIRKADPAYPAEPRQK